MYVDKKKNVKFCKICNQKETLQKNKSVKDKKNLSFTLDFKKQIHF